MEPTLARNWWILALRGGLAILFGVLVCLWPALGWVAIVATFGAFALVDGIFAIALAITGRGRGPWWTLVLEGVFGISAGVLTFLWPGITGLVLLFFIAYWAIATGVFEIVAAIKLRKEIQGEWALIFSGILSVLFGTALVIWPASGALAVAWLIAAYSLAFGALLLVLAFRLRGLARHTSRPGSVPVP